MCNCCYEVLHNFIINYHAWENKRVKKKKPPGLFDNCSKPEVFTLISNKSFELIMHPKFEETFIILILFNTICLCLDWYD